MPSPLACDKGTKHTPHRPRRPMRNVRNVAFLGRMLTYGPMYNPDAVRCRRRDDSRNVITATLRPTSAPKLSDERRKLHVFVQFRPHWRTVVIAVNPVFKMQD